MFLSWQPWAEPAEGAASSATGGLEDRRRQITAPLPGDKRELTLVGSRPNLVGPTMLGNGSFQFSFTNVPGCSFTAQVSTNLAATNGWTSLGSPTEISPGQFQFTDPQATNYPRRFYRVSPP